MNKKILVTGGSGFIGRALTEELRSMFGQENVLAPSSKELNLLDARHVDQYFKEHKIDVVYHMAARHAGIGSGISQELFFFETNLLMNYHIVSAARNHSVEKFITFGSSCSYQRHLNHPALESDLWNGHAENTYGTCKLTLLEHLQAQADMNWVYLIPPNLYGPGDHFGETGTHFVPATVKKFQQAVDTGENCIVIWGDGSQTRDFLYLDDVIRILNDALTTERYDGKPINISTGKQSSILRVTELIRNDLGLNHIEIRCDTTKPTGMKSREIGNGLFLTINPGYQFVRIEDGIRKTIAWYRNTARTK